MRIRMKINLGKDWPEPWKDGEVHDCDQELGAKLVALHMADDVTPMEAKPEAKPAEPHEPVHESVHVTPHVPHSAPHHTEVEPQPHVEVKPDKKPLQGGKK